MENKLKKLMLIEEENSEEVTEFLDSLRQGTMPINEDEEEFFKELELDSERYLDEEIDKLEDPEYKERDPSEEFLQNYCKETKKKTIGVAILSVDIVGSTKLSKRLPQEKYVKIISLFLREVSQIVYNHHGYPLKYIGDEIIAYFPGPDTRGAHDNALFCAYSIKKYLLKILRPLLMKRDLPEIDFRISLNSGTSMITVAGHHRSMQHFDLIGEPINVMKKIQSKAEINSIVVGQSAKSEAHKFWSTKTQEIICEDLDGIKIYKLNISV
ncbi:MAG: adenylate/guanylate cyclase domain-containing protein [Nanoarchaeota archaeon]|nr:adenylate/guanylate cyclase domain-containing protein [Nanoarchaeota archaeon]